MEPPSWLVENTIPNGALVGLYGRPSSGKSFIAIDMSLSVATGLPWQGHGVHHGLVIYISAEGGSGIGKRVLAWLMEHQVDAREPDIAWLTESMSINLESEDVERLLHRIATLDREPVLVVIDTLARCFDGNENEQEDMGRFIKGVDELRFKLGCTVMIVHHTRLDGERERGNTAFRGAADTMIAVARESRTSPIVISCNKQKDSEEFEAFEVDLTVVPGTDSAVIIASRSASELQAGVELAWEVLKAQGPLSWDNWRAATALGRSQFGRAFHELKDGGRLRKEAGQWQAVEGESET